MNLLWGYNNNGVNEQNCPLTTDVIQLSMLMLLTWPRGQQQCCECVYPPLLTIRRVHLSGRLRCHDTWISNLKTLTILSWHKRHYWSSNINVADVITERNKTEQTKLNILRLLTVAFSFWWDRAEELNVSHIKKVWILSLLSVILIVRFECVFDVCQRNE